ncbi:MAG: hypothetical protein IPK03_01875 [Bacteroidetes bacterium]|nr:hypothetical protein [Bacteroidota bacterium]
MRKKHDIHYVLSGESVETEGILPQSWIHNKSDHINIKAIHKQFGTMEAPSFPYHSYWTKLFFGRFNTLKFVPILNYISYNKEEAKKIIIRDLSWRDYGGKHYESVFTRFYQSYILPVKFKIDKRKSHYSALIGANQISREDAINALKQPIDSAERIALKTRVYHQKLNFTEAEFDEIKKRPPANTLGFSSAIHILNRYKKILWPLISLIRNKKLN